MTDYDQFGRSVSIDANFIIIGSKETGDGTGKGDVYLYEIDTTTNSVTRRQTFSSPYGTTDNSFGSSLSINGDYILVGANTYDANGSAFVFKKDANYNVNQLAELHPTDLSSDAKFGTSVCIDNNMIIVGASSDDSKANNAGSAYVYKIYSDTNIAQIEKEYASDAETYSNFGTSVSVSGNFLSIGIDYVDNISYPVGETSEGRVYTYEKDLNQASTPQ